MLKGVMVGKALLKPNISISRRQANSLAKRTVVISNVIVGAGTWWR